MADDPTVVELRVHGVSGTSPALLNCPAEFFEQKADDKSAGLYRRPEWIDDAAHPPPPGCWRAVTEAYSWGGLTSGRARRALWLLFLPFILVDLSAVPLVLMIMLLWRLGSEEPVVTRGDEPARDTKREASEKKPHPPLIVVAATAGVYMWLRVIPRRSARERGGVLADHPGANTDDKGVAAQIDRIAKARALASLTDIGARLVAGLALVAVAVIIGMAVLYLLVGRFDSVVDWSPVLTNISVVITVSLVMGLVGLAVAAFRSRQLRRVVAILWDVVTFWPRANHPLTPPSYGMRTVWDLRLRLAALSKDTETGPVILVAPGQGTVIAAATLRQAKMDNEKYPLLTFGSPLRRLYRQNFPAYFGVEAMDRLRDRQRRPDPRWINLWALSDPIGAWVFDRSLVCTAAEGGTPDMAEALNTVDRRLLDVAPGRYGPDPVGPVCAHSGFWTRDEDDAAVLALQSAVLPGGSAPPDTDATVRPMDRRV